MDAVDGHGTAHKLWYKDLPLVTPTLQGMFWWPSRSCTSARACHGWVFRCQIPLQSLSSRCHDHHCHGQLVWNRCLQMSEGMPWVWKVWLGSSSTFDQCSAYTIPLFSFKKNKKLNKSQINSEAPCLCLAPEVVTAIVQTFKTLDEYSQQLAKGRCQQLPREKSQVKGEDFLDSSE